MQVLQGKITELKAFHVEHFTDYSRRGRIKNRRLAQVSLWATTIGLKGGIYHVRLKQIPGRCGMPPERQEEAAEAAHQHLLNTDVEFYRARLGRKFRYIALGASD